MSTTRPSGRQPMLCAPTSKLACLLAPLPVMLLLGGCPQRTGLIDRDAAFARLKAVALDPFGVDATMVNVYGPVSMLQPGTQVAPRFEEADPTVIARAIDRPTWFFWIDPYPAARWLHPVIYAFVDAATGEVELVGASYYPLIDGLELDRAADKSDPTLVFGPGPPADPTGRRQDPAPAEAGSIRLDKLGVRSLGEAGTECCSGHVAIVIDMHGSLETSANSDEMERRLNQRGYAVQRVRPGVDGPASIAAVEAALDALIASSRERSAPLCQVVLYYDGHGSSFYPKIIAPNKPYKDLAGFQVARKLIQVKACEFSLIIHACYSENWSTPMALGFLPTFRDSAPCARLSIYSSSAGDEVTVANRLTTSRFMDRFFDRMDAAPAGEPLNLAARGSFATDRFSNPLAFQVAALLGSVFGLVPPELVQTPEAVAFAPKPGCPPCCPKTTCGTLPTDYQDGPGRVPPNGYQVQRVAGGPSDLFAQFPNAINDFGRGVGAFAPIAGIPATGGTIADGQFVQLGVDSAASLFLAAINNQCQVVGELRQNADGQPRGLLGQLTAADAQARLGQITTVEPLPDDAGLRLNDLSEDGVGVGTSFDAAGIGHAVIWRTGELRRLPTVDPQAASSANAISRDGTIVVGTETLGTGPSRGPQAVTWSGPDFQVRQQLPPLSADGFGQGLDVHGALVVGGATVGSGLSLRYHPVVWVDGGAPVDLGTLAGDQGFARAVNPAGVIVGNVVQNLQFRAFVWTAADGQVDLNAKVDPAAGLTILNATAINRAGQILCVVADATGAQSFAALMQQP